MKRLITAIMLVMTMLLVPVTEAEIPRTGDITNIRTFIALVTAVTGFLLLTRRRRR